MTNKYLLFFLLLTKLVFSYEDHDIDGVENSLDLCPNTSFELLVDAHGCPLKNPNNDFLGKLTLQIATEVNFDDVSTSDYNHNFLTNYQYHQWNITLSNSQQESSDNTHNRGDLYFSTAYLFENPKVNSKLMMGIKIANGSNDISTGENDYFTALHLSHILNEKQTFFAHFNYTLTGNAPTQNYQNTLGYSVGSGYALSSNYHTTLSYDYIASIYEGNEAYKAISLFNNYLIHDAYYLNLNYSRGLDEFSYKHSLELALGTTF